MCSSRIKSDTVEWKDGYYDKKMRALAAGIALTLSLGLLAGCGGEKKAADNSKKVVNVGIVQLVEHDALDAANKGFIAGMAAKGFKENENVKYDRQNAAGRSV